MVAFSAYRA